MVGAILQTAGTCLSAVENGVGACVLGTAVTAAAVAGVFRLAGFRLGLTCERVWTVNLNRKKKPENLTDYYAVTMEEADANAAYVDASVHWNAMKKQYDAAKLEKEADQLELDAERLREERRKFSEARVAELDAIRAARKARKAAKECAAHEADQSPGNPVVDKTDRAQAKAAKAGKARADNAGPV